MTDTVARNGSPLFVTLVAVLVWALLVLVVTRTRYSSDVRALIVVGAQARFPPAFASIPTAGPWGYDGQMYAALATDPFMRSPDTAHYLDTPWYRATRIMVPALAWVLAVGHPAAAVVWYQLLCWSFALCAVYVLARWLLEEGRSPWWALAAAGSGGTAAVILRSTPDGAALFFMLAALYLHARNRWRPALVLAAAAVLTRETSVLAALAIAGDEFRRRRFVSAGAFAVLPAAVGIAWQLHLRRLLGSAFDAGTRNFDLPFAWLPHKLEVVFRGHHVFWMELLGTLAVLAAAWALFAVASRPAAFDAPTLAFLAFATMGMLLADAVYSEAWAYARALIALPFLAVLIGAREPLRWRRYAVGSVALFYLLVGAAMARGEVRDALGPRGLLSAMRQGTAVPLPTAGARSGATQKPVGVAPPPPLWVLPVANAKGRAGAIWQTRFALENPHARSIRATLELYLTVTDRTRPDRRVVVVDPRRRMQWRDVVGELFGREGTGALEVIAEGGPLAARSLTSNVTLPAADADLIPALTEAEVVHPGELARFEGLAHDPNGSSGIRTNLGVFNLAEGPIRVRVQAFDAGYRALGTFEAQFDPYRFTQVNDLFARFGAPRLDGATAHVSAVTRGGSFLAYASVIRGANASPVYLYPRPLPEAGSTR